MASMYAPRFWHRQRGTERAKNPRASEGPSVSSPSADGFQPGSRVQSKFRQPRRGRPVSPAPFRAGTGFLPVFRGLQPPEPVYSSCGGHIFPRGNRLCGSAAPFCGKALPFRDSRPPLPFLRRGYASPVHHRGRRQTILSKSASSGSSFRGSRFQQRTLDHR